MKLSEKLNWNKVGGLMPAIIQDNETFEILMLGYMNREALQITIESNNVTFFSRSKKRIWVKGETSGNFLKISEITADCDNDSLLILASPLGPTCHLGEKSCFGQYKNSDQDFFSSPTAIIENRKNKMPEGSYLTSLFAAGNHRIAQKIGEEGVEVALALKDSDSQQIINESADLLFHLMVGLAKHNLSLGDVRAELEKRFKSKE